MLSRGFAIGRIFGTNIYATGSFFLLIAYIFWISGGNLSWAAIWCLAIILSLIAHEFGHVFAVRWLLKERSTVILWFLGGICLHEPTRDRRKQIGISLMGPAFGFGLAGLAWIAMLALPASKGPLRPFLGSLLFLNVLLNALNLLPIWPLDGGQALRAALAARLGSGRAALVVRRISIATAIVGGAVALQLGYRIAAIIAILLVADNLLGRGPTHD